MIPFADDYYLCFGYAFLHVSNGWVQHAIVVGALTAFAWDWAPPTLSGGVPELLTDGDKLYLVGHDTLGWEDAAGWTYAVPDALGSVSLGRDRQAVDGAGELLESREWSPYGVEMGDAQAGLGYTGEWWDAAVGLQYLRARWYDGQSGRFLTQDPAEGLRQRVISLHDYIYAADNPMRYDDPSGYYFDERTDRIVRAHKEDFLNSARRHNPFRGVDVDGDGWPNYSLDDNGFAALIASIMAHEPHMQNRPLTDDAGLLMHALENIAATRCVISGSILKNSCLSSPHEHLKSLLRALGTPDYAGYRLRASAAQGIEDALGQCAAQWLLNYYPGLNYGSWDSDFATVGMGNVSLSTAAGFWDGRSTYVTGNDLYVTNSLGLDVPLDDPFRNKSDLEAYQALARQLLRRKVNIEYIAANLAEGALRGKHGGLGHTPFYAALWHHKGINAALDDLTGPSLFDLWGNSYSVVEHMYRPLELWGVGSNWNMEQMDPDAVHLAGYRHFLEGLPNAQP